MSEGPRQRRVPRTREYRGKRRTRLDAKSMRQQWVGSTRKQIRLAGPARGLRLGLRLGPGVGALYNPSPGHHEGLIFRCRAAAGGLAADFDRESDVSLHPAAASGPALALLVLCRAGVWPSSSARQGRKPDIPIYANLMTDI